MKRILFILTCLITFAFNAYAQDCSYENTAFKSGERLSYTLYYNWNFVWVKTGWANMNTVKSRYKGQEAYRASLTTKGNGKLDHFFILRDTLMSYSTLDMRPLYFRKGAEEGKRYTVDEVWYSYKDNKCNVKHHRRNNRGKIIWKDSSYDDCIYDMMNIFLKARSFDASDWKEGYTMDLPMADGKGMSMAKLRYNGKENIKAENDKTYRCLSLSYIENDDDKEKEVVRFFITDDLNHIPIRLDMYLRVGSAKAFLNKMSGIRNPIKSQIK